MNRLSAVISIAVAFLLSIAPMGAMTASAASDYDTVIKHSVTQIKATNTMHAGACSTDKDDNLTQNWEYFLYEPQNYYGSAVTYREPFIAMLSQNMNKKKGVAVVQRWANSPYTSVGGCDMNSFDQWIEVSVSDNDNLVFTDLYGGKQLAMQGNNYKALIHYSTNDGSLKVVSVYQNDRFIQQAGIPDGYENPFFINFDITYPTGFDGVTPNAGVTPPKQKIYPRVSWVIQDKKLSAKYEENIPNASHMSWIINKTDADGNKVGDPIAGEADKNMAANGMGISYELPERGRYALTVGVTSLPPYLEIDEKYDVQPTTILFNADGGDYFGDTESFEECADGFCENLSIRDKLIANCIKEAFPFVDMGACIENMAIIGSMLSFGTIKTKNQWEASNGCYNLSVIDDWMNLSNNTVCPQVPPFVRTVVTPFVMFAVGLMMVKFVARQGGDGF